MPTEKTQADRGTFYFDPDDPIYREHFPGNPVVPGSLIIQGFLTTAGKWLEKEPSLQIKNFRFKRFIAPGRYGYEIEKTAATGQTPALKCSLLQGKQIVATGVIVL